MEPKKNKPIKKLLIKRLTPTSLLPKKGSLGAAGYDLCAS